MPNMPRKDAHPKKYAGKQFLDYEEAMDYLGIGRSTLYSYITDLDIETKKFKRERRRFLTIEDVKLLEQIIETPGMFEQVLAERQAKAAQSGEKTEAA